MRRSNGGFQTFKQQGVDHSYDKYMTRGLVAGYIGRIVKMLDGKIVGET